MKTKLWSFLDKNTWLLIVIILASSFFIRIWQLGKIGEQIFDEVYFVKFAQNYLAGISFFDIHPPLGKLIIALGIKTFGDTSFTWRIMPAIFGTLIILVGYLTGKELSSKLAGIFVALILSLDGMILVYSRIGLIDIFLVLFVLWGFLFFLKFVNRQKLLFLFLAGISLGLAAAVKYIGGLLLLLFIFMIFVKKISIKKYFWHFLLFLIIVPAAIYLAFFLFNFPANDFWPKVLEWHRQSFNYNITLQEGHPYGSKWWQWFLLLRPIWFYFKDLNGQYLGIIGLGNPLAWWSGVVIIPLLLWGSSRGRKNDLIILGGFLIFLLFWVPFSRVLFYYHALISFVFLSLGLGLCLERLWKNSRFRSLVILFFAVLLLFFIFFWPIWMAVPLETKHFYWRIWLKGWI